MKRRVLRIFAFLILGAIVNFGVAWGCAMLSMDQATYSAPANAKLGFMTPPFHVESQEPWILAKNARSLGLRVHVYERIDLASALDDFVHYAMIANAQHATFWGDVAATYGSNDDLRKYVSNGKKAQRLHEAFLRVELLPPIQATAQALKARINALDPIPQEVLNERPTSGLTRIDTLVVVDAGWPFKAMRGADVLRVTVPTVQASLVKAIRLSTLATNGPQARSRLIPVSTLWPGFAINTVFYAAILWLLFAGPFVWRRRRRIRRGLCPKCAYDLRGTRSDACPECGAPMGQSAAVR